MALDSGDAFQPSPDGKINAIVKRFAGRGFRCLCGARRRSRSDHVITGVSERGAPGVTPRAEYPHRPDPGCRWYWTCSVPGSLQTVNIPNISYRPLANYSVQCDLVLVNRRNEPSAAVRRFIEIARANPRGQKVLGHPAAIAARDLEQMTPHFLRPKRAILRCA